MRLEPVYLVAPKPKPRSMPTRRAFLFAGGTFAAGTLIGGACGYSLAAAVADEPADGSTERPRPVKPELVPTGDVELDALRQFAVEASMSQLLEKAPAFLVAQFNDYSRDPVLWYGVERIASAVLADAEVVTDHRIVSLLIENVEGLEPPAELRLRERIPMLRARRDEVRRRR